MPETDPTLQEKLAGLHATYLKGLPERLQVLHTQVTAYLDQAQAGAGKDGANDTGKQAEITCHNLAGSAAAYGFQTVGECAKKLEEQVRELISNPDADRAGVCEAIRRDLQTLHGLVETARKEEAGSSEQ